MPSSKNSFGLELPWQVSAGAMAATCALASVAAASAPFAAASPISETPAWQFLASFAAATLIVLLLLKTVRGSKVFNVIFLLAVAGGAGFLFSALGGPDLAVLAAAFAILLRLAWPIVGVHDAILLFGLAGIAADLGEGLHPVTILVILATLSFYDIIAVYGTKHMVRMAVSLLRHKAFFAMILPAAPKGFAAPLAKVGPDQGFTFLGTGDLALPAMLAAAASRESPVHAAAVTIGATLGLVVLGLLFAGKNKGRPMPALPPVAAGAIAGYAIAFFAR
jgi:presenilin-like A22 family membrane protease